MASELKYTQADLDFFSDNADDYFRKWHEAEARIEAAKKLTVRLLHDHGLVNRFDPECSPEKPCLRCELEAALGG